MTQTPGTAAISDNDTLRFASNKFRHDSLSKFETGSIEFECYNKDVLSKRAPFFSTFLQSFVSAECTVCAAIST